MFLAISSASCTGIVGAPAGSTWEDRADAAVTGASQSADSATPAIDCDQPQVAVTPLQRLSRRRYANSARALLGVVNVDESQLAEDEKVGAFDGNVVAPVSDLLVEQYTTSAEALALAARDKLETLVPCDRPKLGDDACADAFIRSFGRRAYRRPLSDDEHAAYSALQRTYAAAGYVNGLRVVVQTMLQSPNFLYHVELAPSTASPGTTVAALDAFELASRLSFFLTESPPDDTLLDAAQNGELSDDGGLSAQAMRLFDMELATEVFTRFHTQWLGLDGLDSLSKDNTAFPAFNADTGAAMRAETSQFLAHVLREDDATLSTLFTAPYSFPAGPLRDIYGLPATSTPLSGPVALDPNQRAGLLTQPSFLALHAHASQTSPVSRGTVIIRNLLCEDLPDPPPNINAKAPDPAPGATTRERFAEHERNAACAGCHVRIDGIGFGFEEFDAIGAFRATEAGKNVDATGHVIGTRDLDGDFDGVVELANKLVVSREFSDCAASQWFRFAVARFEGPEDSCSLQPLKDTFAVGRHDVPALLRSIVLSAAFRSKRVREDAP